MTENKVFFDVMSSLDGFMAPEGMDSEHAGDPNLSRLVPRFPSGFNTLTISSIVDGNGELTLFLLLISICFTIAYALETIRLWFGI